MVPLVTSNALTILASKDQFSESLESLGLANKYQKYRLTCNPFPAIGVFSLPTSRESQFPSEVFAGASIHIRRLMEDALQKTKPTVIFLNAQCGQGKSHFLGNLALNLANDKRIYPLFCQVYTSGGFSVVAERAIQWIGLEGYCNLMFSFIENLGFKKDELFAEKASYVFGELVSVLAKSFMIEERTVERIMKPFLRLDEGYAKLFQTSHMYKNLILITLARLIKKTSDRKVLLIVDGLENRWLDMYGNNKEMFFDNVIRFLELTKGDSMVVFSDSNCLKEDFSLFLRTSNFECTIKEVDLPCLNVFKSMKLVSNYLASASAMKSPSSLNPFTRHCIKHLRKVTGGNTRQLVTLCHYLLEVGLESELPTITLDAAKHLE